MFKFGEPKTKILESSKTTNVFSDLPEELQNHIQQSMTAYFEPEDEETVVENDDGSISEKKIDYRMRNFNPESSEDNELTYSRYSVSYDGTVLVKQGSEFEYVDEDSFISEFVTTSKDMTIPIHYLVYYSMCACPESEEIVMREAIVHSFTYLEYLASAIEMW